ncbi:MAG: hypothetical protein H6739_00220 [Alphaproteobacteria bacterium]|nr:hypothetical protein [Alphaproteobacteria bacterium]
MRSSPLSDLIRLSILTLLGTGLSLGCGDKDTDDSAATDDTSAEGDADTDTDSDADADSDSDTDLSFASDVEPIIQGNCSPCHTSNTSGGLSMASGAGYGNLVDVPSGEAMGMDRVEPGDPGNSYMWRKLEGTHNEAGGSGDRMPKNGTMSQGDLDIIEQWISGGANP